MIACQTALQTASAQREGLHTEQPDNTSRRVVVVVVVVEDSDEGRQRCSSFGVELISARLTKMGSPAHLLKPTDETNIADINRDDTRPH